jgi:hypothetical protein
MGGDRTAPPVKPELSTEMITNVFALPDAFNRTAHTNTRPGGARDEPLS